MRLQGMNKLLLAMLAAVPLVAVPDLGAADAKPEATKPDAAKSAATAPAIPFVGVDLDEVDDALAYHLDLANDLGVMVADVSPRSPAEAMGLRRYDVITGADGQQIYTPRAFVALVRAKAVGDVIKLQVRRGAKTVDLSGTLAARPPEMDGPRSEGLMPRGFAPRHSRPPGGPDGRRQGTLTQPDGSTMEWQIEETPTPTPTPPPATP